MYMSVSSSSGVEDDNEPTSNERRMAVGPSFTDAPSPDHRVVPEPVTQSMASLLRDQRVWESILTRAKAK